MAGFMGQEEVAGHCLPPWPFSIFLEKSTNQILCVSLNYEDRTRKPMCESVKFHIRCRVVGLSSY